MFSVTEPYSENFLRFRFFSLGKEISLTKNSIKYNDPLLNQKLICIKPPAVNITEKCY